MAFGGSVALTAAVVAAVAACLASTCAAEDVACIVSDQAGLWP